MNRFNLDSLKNITVPDEWIENALNVPETHSRKKPVPIWRLNRVIAAAACFVLICVMSIPLYLFNRSGVDIPVAPATPTGSSAAERSSDDTSKESLYSSISVLVDPTEKSTSTGFTESGPTDPVEKTTSSENTKATESGTGHQQTDPTEPMTSSTPIVIPTNTIPTEESTGNWVNVTASCAGAFPARLLPEDGKIYCRMYDSTGTLVGDRDIYSSQHRVTSMSEINGYIFVSYLPEDKGIELQKGRYSYCFYTESGTVVFEGSVLV